MNEQPPVPPNPPLPPGNLVAGQSLIGALSPSIPDYALIRRIGGGAYGDVWLARSTTGAFRAVKIVWRHTFEDDRPFQREFEGIQHFERLSREHPSQLALFHVGRGEGYFYYVIELADDVATPHGEDGGLKIEDGKDSERGTNHQPSAILNPQHYESHTLRADLGQGRLPAARVLELGLALTEALSHLHTNGLVHRDVKPSNIIFVGGKPKLADIGLVTDAGDTRSIVGTEGYLAPEGPGTLQADLYALGKVLYEAATGLDRRELPQLPPDLREWPDARLVFELNEIILKACETDPRKRYQTAREIYDDLVLLQRGQSIKRRRTIQERIHGARRIGLATAVVMLVAAAAVFLWQTLKPHSAPADGILGTQVDEARRAYYSGVEAMRLGNARGFSRALDRFTAAIKADPNFVLAHARLFETYLMGEDYDVYDTPDGKAEQLAKLSAKLGELAPTNAETHAAKAIVYFLNERKWDEAEKEFQAARGADADCRMALVYYGYMLTRQRRGDAAKVVLNRALKIDKDSPLITKFLGHCEYVQGNYDKALHFYMRASELEREYPSGWYWEGRVNLVLGNYERALDCFEQHELRLGLQNVTESYKTFRQALQEDPPGARGRGYWLKCLDHIGNSKAGVPYWYAECHARLGHTNEALEGLEKAVEKNDTVRDLLVDEFWDDYRKGEKFIQLLERVGLDRWAR